MTGKDDVELSDEELIALIAEKQDQQAFSRLFDRYQQRGYSLAAYITHDSDSAEEAFQEAMIKIWRSAGTYNGSGKIEAWIMRIIAHAAVQQVRGSKRKRTQQMIDERQQCEAPLPHTRLADTELLLLLRKALVALSAPERELIALRFAAGMSQPEISKTLGIPQQTVSYRIDAIIKRLRTIIPGAEVSAAALPMAEILREAMLSGPPAPAGAYAQVVKSISPSRRSVRRSTRSTRAPRSSANSTFAVAAVVLAIAGVVTFSLIGPKPANSAATVPAATILPAAAPVQISPAESAEPAETPKFSYKWTFENGLGSDLKAQGFGRWDKERKILTADKGYVISFPFALPPRPVKITGQVLWEIDHNAGCGLNALEPDNDDVLSRMNRVWFNHLTIPVGPIAFTAFLWDDKVVELLDNRVVRVVDYADRLAGKKLMLIFNHCSLVSITAEAVDEIPKEYTDIETLTRDLKPSTPIGNTLPK